MKPEKSLCIPPMTTWPHSDARHNKNNNHKVRQGHRMIYLLPWSLSVWILLNYCFVGRGDGSDIENFVQIWQFFIVSVPKRRDPVKVECLPSPRGRFTCPLLVRSRCLFFLQELPQYSVSMFLSRLSVPGPLGAFNIFNVSRLSSLIC